LDICGYNQKNLLGYPRFFCPQSFFYIDPTTHIHATVSVTEISLHTTSLIAGQI